MQIKLLTKSVNQSQIQALSGLKSIQFGRIMNAAKPLSEARHLRILKCTHDQHLFLPIILCPLPSHYRTQHVTMPCKLSGCKTEQI